MLGTYKAPPFYMWLILIATNDIRLNWLVYTPAPSLLVYVLFVLRSSPASYLIVIRDWALLFEISLPDYGLAFYRSKTCMHAWSRPTFFNINCIEN